MFTSFERILEEFVDNPNKLIINADFSEERLSSENTNGENLSILHGDIIDFDRSATLFSLFEKRVFENKEKICIQDNDADISFIEFYNSVCRTDAAIREKTKGRKQVIGVFAERSVEMYVAIYAIIRGGNAYMPIAVDQPCKRTEYMMKNSGASLILCQDKLAKKINAFDSINVTKIIDDNSPFAAFSPAAQPDDIAYVIYTSGTTGNPKGAMIKHTSIVNRINWMHRKYPSDDDSVILQKTPYTFDVSVWEIFWWGIFGGKLAFSKPNEHFLPEKIADEVCRRQVTHIHFVPSVFSAFLNYIEKNNISVSRFSSMKYVFLSGEALDSSSVNRFYRLFDAYDVALHNLYGPTECAVDVTYFDCPRKPLDVIPIGKPIDNTSAYVMDSKLNPVPVGINGELYIGGANVGAGYINDEALTNMSFINSEKYGRLYKTGDLARINEAGEIIFCGRKDGQLKINGQRIEIDEIEHTIMSISEITDAVVIPRKTGEKIRLIAFYSGKELKDTEIEEKCLENLPRYMIPHRFLHLESIPVNQNGKTDRKKLEAFEIISASDAEYESPITKTEIKIADAFKKYLKTDLVGRHTDFIKSGGSSIDIINFVSEPEYRGVSVSDFISSPTPAGIADILVKNKTSHFKQLQILKYSDTAEKSVVIVPFAGASPAAFAAFAEYICNSLGASVYYLPYVGSPDPVHASANEIQELCKISDVVLYGHCIGAQLCIRIAEIIENGGTVLSGLVLAGYVPSVRNPKRNIWDFIPDTLIAKVLSKAGADFSALTNSALEEIISNFKKDTSLLQDNHISPCKKIAAPAAIILNKDDLFTKGYRYPERNYSPFLSDMNFKILDGQNHYFQTEKKEVIAQAINSFFNR
ncbi:MAG: amino acid adenylation domain-containing protein [Clostridia bacterium]|nr:amino acid adenylation domain-containing protein [Clostridia bacterium]